MPILTEGEKQQICARAEAVAGDKENLKHKEVELQAALQIIEKLLGKSWYNKACENKSKLPVNPSPEYDFLTSKVGPIAGLLMEHPFGYVKIIQFAHYLKELWNNNTNIEEKLREYTLKEKDSDISFEHFERLSFELEVAAFFKTRGMNVWFIPEQKGVKMRKTPEFKLSSVQGTTYVECKKKDAYIRLERNIYNICRYIGEQIFKKMAGLHVNYSINITFEKEIKHSDISPVLELLNQSIEKQQKCFKERDSGIIIEGKKLRDIDVLESLRNIPKLPEESTTIKYAEETFQAFDSYHIDFNLLLNKIRAREIDILVFNYRQVIIYSCFMPTKVQTILHSIADAGNQLLKSKSEFGVVAIDLSELSLGRTAKKDISEVINSLPKQIKSMPHVSAVLLFVTQRFMKDGCPRSATEICACINPLATYRLPHDIEETLTIGGDMCSKSLLED